MVIKCTYVPRPTIPTESKSVDFEDDREEFVNVREEMDERVGFIRGELSASKHLLACALTLVKRTFFELDLNIAVFKKLYS